ncbi:Dabb family protein [Youxingia wuxianensis]|uniref:Dabb family protein n=1 Tax=Youxingia wuxianensis TaxID=2763678 RepID=A0A926IH11_9FIRM|nr:Dabb family protein [Youxingia wuxianensis]MBC8584655.1 Dabb family protein [Youxingia wuxianensis]
MIKHIVMYCLEDVAEGHTKDENAKKMKTMLELLPDSIEGIIKMEVGINMNPNGYDCVLYSEFESKQALEAYQQNPEHQQVRKFVHKVINDRVAVDYEVDA